MENTKRYICRTLFLIALLSFFPAFTYAANTENHAGISGQSHDTLLIATVDNRPLSTDRLLYTAFSDIGRRISVVAGSSLQQGYVMTDAGERDGVISSTPNMTQLYPNLIQVPVVLDYNIVMAFSRADTDIVIDSWEDVSAYSAGILTERVYIRNKISEDTPVTVKETTKLLFEGLLQGEYDVVVLSARAHEELILPDGVARNSDIETLPEYLYVNKKNAALVPEIAGAIGNMISDGRAEKILSDIQIPLPNQKKTVLHILSTNMQVEREEQFSEKLKQAFEDDMSLEWYTIELNSRRFSVDDNRLLYHSALLRQDCVSRNIAAIIVSGDDAMSFLKDYYFLFFRNVPVLFYGTNGVHEDELSEYEPYFTGITEDLAIYETVSLGLSLFPETENIFVINDFTTEGLSYRADSERKLSLLSEDYNIEYNEDVPCDSLIERIRELPEDSIVFIGSYFIDSERQYYPIKEIKRLLEKNCAVPIFALYSTAVEYNSIGGKCLDYGYDGVTAASMLRRILNGENNGGVSPDSHTGASRWVFDKLMLERWGIRERDLPENSLILNKTVPIWESDPWFVFSVFALILLGIAVSYLLIRYLKQRELFVKDAKIHEVNSRLERIINTAPLAFMASVNGKVVVANEYIKKYLGISLGDDPRSVYRDPVTREALLHQVVSETVENRIVEFNTAGGGFHRFLSNYSTVEYDGEQGFILWAMDIEDNERKKDQIRTAQRDLQMILDSMPIALRISDVKSNEIIYANNTCLEMLGYESLEELRGKNICDTMPPFQSDGESSRDRIVRLSKINEPVEIDMEYIDAKGEIIETRVKACKIMYYGQKTAVATLKDMRAEKERQKMLLSAAKKEREANLLKSRFLVNMSHEIRTPMNAIIGLAEIELRKGPEGEAREVFKKINTSAKNLLEIINDILDLSKIEADKIELFEDDFELEDVLNSALLVAAPRLDGKNVEFLLDTALDLPPITGDRTRLWQILKNILDNSAKYTEEGRIILSVFEDKALSDAEKIMLTFVIEDTGIGMNEKQLRKLFQPYEQVKNEAQKRYSGTGLGMAITKQLCEIMGGNMDVKSAVGVGTVTTIKLPFRRSFKKDEQRQIVKPSALRGYKILVADGDETSLNIISKLLEYSNAECIKARGGTEALELISAENGRNGRFDLVLLNYTTEGEDGLETADRIHLALPDIPKLLMATAYQRLSLKDGFDGSGIDGIIEKPFIPSSFIRRLCVTLGIEEEAEESLEALPQFKDVKLLLCEDYELNREVASAMLSEFGIVPDIAENGKRGIEMLEKGGEYDLIFMDLQMPVMDGYEAAKAIRANPLYDKIPIVSLTADAMTEVVAKCLELGMNDHIAKPIEFANLKKVFLKWLPQNKRVHEDSFGRVDGEASGRRA